MSDRSGQTLSENSISGCVAADRAGLSELLQRARGFSEHSAISDLLRYQFLIVVEELMTNIITHGSPPAGSCVAFDFRICHDAVSISLNDRGVPFDPRRLPGVDEEVAPSRNEGGWGWPLILSWCEKLNYERVDDRNVLTLCLRC